MGRGRKMEAEFRENGRVEAKGEIRKQEGVENRAEKEVSSMTRKKGRGKWIVGKSWKGM